jgi:6-pyruvoyltetrahydropterin/6-carboxytetrahydropterin synthase
MYKIKVQSHFSSAHNLKGYKGKCEELHGHNWRVEIVVISEDLDDTGMVMDFKALKDLLRETLGGLDHKYLNDVSYFKDVNPTSENIAKYIYEDILRKKPDLKLAEVTVYETDTSSATYSKEA